MSSSSFGKWYDEQKNDGDGSSGSGGLAGSFSNWTNSVSTTFDTEQVLPLFNTEGLQNFSFDNMKQTMEAQMPKKILGMGYQQRFKVFCALLFLSALFFVLAFFIGLPTIAIKPQKFALSFTCGSLTFMGSFGILKGPYEHFISMFTLDRIFFTTIYFGSMFVTLWLTCTKGGITGRLYVFIASGIQLLSLLWYLISFLPGGTMGLQLVLRAVITMLQPIIKGCLQLQGKCMSICFTYFMSSSSSNSR